MKYLIGVTGSILIICLLLTAAFTSVSPIEAHQSDRLPTGENSYQLSGDGETGYILSVYDGKVAAFKKGSSVPVYVSTRRIADLPEQDKLDLEQGIPAENRRRLTALIEEYCS